MNMLSNGYDLMKRGLSPLSAVLKGVRKKIPGGALRLLIVILFYLCVSIYYLGPSVTRCSSVTYGFGDNTAGPIWQFEFFPNNPIGGYITQTNYPVGENISNPVSSSFILQKTLIWGVQKIAGPVCGYNIVNLVGFIFSATAMFCFIYWLTRNKWISLLAGYVVSFAPYFQFKVGGHPSYGYQGLLILSVWMFLRAYIEKRRSSVIAFILATTACFYWDPYFSLLVFTALTPFILTACFASVYKKGLHTLNAFIANLRPVILGCLGVVILLTPLVFVNIAYKDDIASYSTGARGNLMEAANKCGNLPTDYLVPPDANYFFSKILGPKYGEKVQLLRHGCNTSEQNVAIGYAIMLIVLFGGVIILWEILNKRKNPLSNTNAGKFEVWAGLVSMAIFSAVLALPPSIGPIKTPTYILLSNVQIWRILSREFIVFQIAITAIFSLVVLYFSKTSLFRARNITKQIIFCLIVLATFVQYQTAKPFSGSTATFDYKKNTPEIYNWVATQDDIHVIADYPLDKVGESEAPSYYLTAQTIHKKRLLNSSLPNSLQETMRFSIKDLSDPQSFPVLRALGVDTLIIHGISSNELSRYSDIEILRYQDIVDKFNGGSLAVARIKPGKVAEVAIVLDKGFPINGAIMKSVTNIEYEVMNNAEIVVQKAKENNSGIHEVCFEAKMADERDRDTLNIIDEKGNILKNQPLNGQYQTLRFESQTGQRVRLTNTVGHNMRINNLGCK